MSVCMRASIAAMSIEQLFFYKPLVHQKPSRHGLGNGTGLYGLTITSRHMRETVERYGIVERKSLVACPSPELAASSAFWLGYLDGDGTVGHGRGRTSTVSTGWYVSAQAAEMLGKHLHDLGLCPKAPLAHPTTTTPLLYGLRVSGGKAVHILAALHAASPYRLQRKWCRAQFCFERYLAGDWPRSKAALPRDEVDQLIRTAWAHVITTTRQHPVA
jgi:hypothetical protein